METEEWKTMSTLVFLGCVVVGLDWIGGLDLLWQMESVDSGVLCCVVEYFKLNLYLWMCLGFWLFLYVSLFPVAVLLC